MEQADRFGNVMQLCCESGYLLRLDPFGAVSGTEDEHDPFTWFIRSSGNGSDGSSGVGLVKFKGLESPLYLCFTDNGILHGELNEYQAGTIFEEIPWRSHTCYRSTFNPDWYIGINNRGEAKPGNKTEIGKISTKFLRRRLPV